ncbi:hypothetical protein JMJ77_0006250 [Colletotrichum scovillei]|uniref:Uncharacterized protein n=1 Tax=Colletotrichum scovillei TaxID=1209932 RepID=A0A9P7RIC9_9PEZI|nr:hypothetical protein JMJ77_0006250 [Colletotrichum scovillei]KAG7077489.1 hypothetical protein JMJ76_0014735 [Colletotrichum scovillei]KAG7084618.1 hypothetical protein JMJ78_0010051 [Colletotrichum scovillei]
MPFDLLGIVPTNPQKSHGKFPNLIQLGLLGGARLLL